MLARKEESLAKYQEMLKEAREVRLVAYLLNVHMVLHSWKLAGEQMKYRKIPIISPGLIFVQKAFLLDLWSGELIFEFGGAYYWREFCVSKWVGLDNKNSFKHYENSLEQLETASTNSPLAYIQGGLLSEGYLRLNFGGGGIISWRADFIYVFIYLFILFIIITFFGGGGLIIGILR